MAKKTHELIITVDRDGNWLTELVKTTEKSALDSDQNAIKTLEMMSEKGNINAMKSLEEIYTSGTRYKSPEKANYWLEKAASAGDNNSMIELAKKYEKGDGFPQDYEKAFSWYQKAGNYYDLGRMYEHGLGVKQDYEKAADAYRNGGLRALEPLGDLYVKGLGVPQDYESAIRLYRKAHDNKVLSDSSKLTKTLNLQANIPVVAASEEALKKARAIGKKGDESRKAGDLAKALEYYQEAAELGLIEAQYYLALCFLEGKGVSQSYQQYSRWIYSAAKQGFAKAQMSLGFAYRTGDRGLPLNLEKAAHWYKKAADQGYTDAYVTLGSTYMDLKRYEEAFAYYSMAAHEGDPLGMIGIAHFYDKGIYFAQDYGKAFNLLKKAADLGHSVAMEKLGEYYHLGHYVAKDLSKAFSWYLEAAKLGDVVSMRRVGRFYMKGSGTAIDRKQGEMWLIKAANKGDPDALYNLGCYYVDGTELPKDEVKGLRLIDLAYQKGYKPRD